MSKFKKSIFKTDPFLLFTSIIFTIISQSPLLIENGLGRFLLLIWLLPLFRVIIFKRIIIDKVIKTPILICFFYTLYLLLAEAFIGNEYLVVPSLRNSVIMLIMMLLGYYLAPKITTDNLTNLLSWSSLLGGFIICILVYKSAFGSGFDISSRENAYGSKNSVSQIIFSCFIFVFLLSPTLKIKYIKYPILLFMLFMILILKSRATFLGFVIFFFILIIKSKNKKLQFFIISFIMIVFLILLLSPKLSSIFIDGILAGGKDINDLEDLSSGRMSMFQSFPQLFEQYMFFGRGRYYLESFPLSTLVETGIIGSLIIFSFIFWVYKMINTYFTINNKLDLCLIVLFYSYLLNALFEEEAPFGPGAKSFLFWLPFGFILYKRTHLISNLKEQI